MPLTSPLLVLLLGGGAAALGALTARRRLPRWRRAASALGSLLLVVAGAGAGTNDQYGLYRSWRDLLGVHSPDLVGASTPNRVRAALQVLRFDATLPTHGTLLAVRIPGPVSGLTGRSGYVYLPPQYRDPAYATTRFPVVEAFPGSPGRPSDWIRGLHVDAEMDAAIAAGLVRPAIVVVAQTNGGLLRSSECANTVAGNKEVETYLTTDVPDWVDANLRAQLDHWVTVGYSTGGYCALDLALRHPARYDAAVSLDGYAHALSDHYARGIWRSRADRLAHSPDWWVEHRRPEQVAMYLLYGTRDGESRRAATRFRDVLLSAGWWGRWDALVAQPRGRHTFPAWEAALRPALEWALPAGQPFSRNSARSSSSTAAIVARNAG